MPARPHKLTLSALSLCLLAALSGCASTGSSPTTQPSQSLTLPDQVTLVAASLTAAEDAVTLGLETKVISGKTYWSDIDPIFTAGNAALTQLQTAANQGDKAGVETYSQAVLSAVAKLQPFITQAKTTKGK